MFPKEQQHTYLKIVLGSTLCSIENHIGFAQKRQIVAIWRFTAFNNFGVVFLYFIVAVIVTSALNVYNSFPKDTDKQRKIINLCGDDLKKKKLL